MHEAGNLPFTVRLPIADHCADPETYMLVRYSSTCICALSQQTPGLTLPCLPLALEISFTTVRPLNV